MAFEPGLLDSLSRVDELLIELINKQNGNSIPQTPLPGSAPTYIGLVGKIIVDMSSARTTAERFLIPSANFLQALSDGDMDGIEISLGSQSAVAVPLTDFVCMPVYGITEIHVKNTAVAGRTELRLYFSNMPLTQYMRSASGVVGFEVSAHEHDLESLTTAVPANATEYWLPATGSIDMTEMIQATFWVRKATNKPDAVELYHSIDNTNFYKAEGYEIATADFVLTNWNTIEVSADLYYAKLRILTGATGAGAMEAHCIPKA